MKAINKYSLIATLILSSACGDDEGNSQRNNEETDETVGDGGMEDPAAQIPERPSDLATCSTGDVENLGDITLASANPEETRFTELSGVVASRKQPVLWVHDDSGNDPNVYAVSIGNEGIPDGTPLAIFKLIGVALRDWEDIAIGPGPTDGLDFIYVGDIGDKNRDGLGADIVIHRFPEPSVTIPTVASEDTDVSLEPTEETIIEFDSLHANFPEGLAENSDAMFLDSLGGKTPDLYVVTSGNGISTPNRLLRMSTKSPSEVVTMEFVTTLIGGEAGDPELTGADMSADGRWIVLRTLRTAMLWSRADKAPMEEVFAERPCTAIIPTSDVESGEGGAIGFNAQSDGYFTTIEGNPAPLWYVPLSER